MQEVSGSIPLGSTIPRTMKYRLFPGVTLAGEVSPAGVLCFGVATLVGEVSPTGVVVVVAISEDFRGFGCIEVCGCSIV